ncbi:MAG TPA: hypothetical protein VG496_17065 [Myxococcales bacterium]|nr:hypothetical protein [Myxococcales bacterium]
MRVVPLIAAMLVAGAARASSVWDEISVGAAQSTPRNPQAGNVSNLLGVSVDVTHDWTITGTAQVSVWEAPTAATGAGSNSGGGTVTAFSGGADWYATDNWAFGATLAVSPESTITSNSRMTVPLRTQGGEGESTNTRADAFIRAASSYLSGEFLATYDTAGFSNLEWSFSGAVALSRFATNQRIESARRLGGSNSAELSNAQLRSLCAPPSSSCNPYLVAIDGFSDELRSGRLSLSALATIFHDTDVGLSADYYRYFDDPANVGVYSLPSVGQFGAGAPIAPLRFVVRPEVTHRFGPLSLRLWVQAGEYAANVGQGTQSIGAKVQYRFSRTFRMWIGASGQRDVGPAGDVSRLGWVSLGAAYRL